MKQYIIILLGLVFTARAMDSNQTDTPPIYMLPANTTTNIYNIHPYQPLYGESSNNTFYACQSYPYISTSNQVMLPSASFSRRLLAYNSQNGQDRPKKKARCERTRQHGTGMTRDNLEEAEITFIQTLDEEHLKLLKKWLAKPEARITSGAQFKISAELFDNIFTPKQLVAFKGLGWGTQRAMLRFINKHKKSIIRKIMNRNKCSINFLIN